MGTRERRQREIAERERRFLDTAQLLIVEDGLLNLQMSKIAARCEYAVGTLYLHFESKEDLLLALVTRQVQEHVELFERVATWKAPTRMRMLAIGVADMIFVRRNPLYFRVAQYSLCEVVWDAASAARREAFLKATRPMGAVVSDIVTKAIADGELARPEMNADELSTGLWSICMGFQKMVHAQGVLEDFEVPQPYQVMCGHIQHWLNGLGWKPISSGSNPAAEERLIQQICDEVFDEAAFSV
ncbi:MAG: TetR/AcrR family transcriptional regulator [Panacagrimonas sp.]